METVRFRKLYCVIALGVILGILIPIDSLVISNGKKSLYFDQDDDEQVVPFVGKMDAEENQKDLGVVEVRRRTVWGPLELKDPDAHELPKQKPLDHEAHELPKPKPKKTSLMFLQALQKERERHAAQSRPVPVRRPTVADLILELQAKRENATAFEKIALYVAEYVSLPMELVGRKMISGFVSFFKKFGEVLHECRGIIFLFSTVYLVLLFAYFFFVKFYFGRTGRTYSSPLVQRVSQTIKRPVNYIVDGYAATKNATVDATLENDKKPIIRVKKVRLGNANYNV